MLLSSVAFGIVTGSIIGYLKGFQLKYFGFKKNYMLLVIIVGTFVYFYANDQVAIAVVMCAMYLVTFFCLTLGQVLGALFGQRTGRLTSWIVRESSARDVLSNKQLKQLPPRQLTVNDNQSNNKNQISSIAKILISLSLITFSLSFAGIFSEHFFGHSYRSYSIFFVFFLVVASFPFFISLAYLGTKYPRYPKFIADNLERHRLIFIFGVLPLIYVISSLVGHWLRN